MNPRWTRHEKWLAILAPAILVGAFEYVRHRYLMGVLSMEAGNWLTASLAFVASFVVVGSLYTVLDRARQEAERRRRQVDLFEERDRIAAALHDGICQTLFFANVKLGAAESALGRGEATRATSELAEGRYAVQVAHDDVRQAIFNLKTTQPPTAGLLDALREYVDEYRRQTNTAAHLIAEEPLPDIAPEAEVQLLHIVREALWNVRKHAGARTVAVTVGRADDDVAIEVRDDGRGFDVEAAIAGRRSFGLRLMQERAAFVGGRIRITSAPDAGTRLRVDVPNGAWRTRREAADVRTGTVIGTGAGRR